MFPDRAVWGRYEVRAVRKLPPQVRDHLTCRVVERLEMIKQHQVIEGLLQPE